MKEAAPAVNPYGIEPGRIYLARELAAWLGAGSHFAKDMERAGFRWRSMACRTTTRWAFGQEWIDWMRAQDGDQPPAKEGGRTKKG